VPRPKTLRNDLSKGWKRLYKLRELPLSKKEEHARIFLNNALKKYHNPVVCWSGGKDSGVVLHLTLQLKSDIPVIHVDTGVDFPENNKFVRKMVKCWNLNLLRAYPNKDEDFWSIGRKWGWPIYGKHIASNVGRARRTGNIRSQLASLEKTLVQYQLHISTKCSEYVLGKPSRKTEHKLGADLKIIGLRADESRARVRLWVDHGDHYFVKHYFAKNNGIWKLNPIATWTEKDIYDYHEKYGIRMCPLYKKGYPRNGCWPCAMAIRNGQLKRLRKHHPQHFRKLLLETPMGKELMRAKMLSMLGRTKKKYSYKEISLFLKEHPDAFDVL